MDLIALQGMHAHAGVSSVAAALAWSITRSPDSGGRSVFIDGAPSSWGATAIFGIPAAFPSWISAGNDLKGLLSRAALYDDAVLTLPARPGDPAPDAALARSLMAELIKRVLGLAALLPAAFFAVIMFALITCSVENPVP